MRNLQLLPRTLTPVDTVREKTIPEDVPITDSMREQGIYSNAENMMTVHDDENWVDENKMEDEEKTGPTGTPVEYANSVDEAENRPSDTLPNPKDNLNLTNQMSSGMPLAPKTSDGPVTNPPVPASQYGPNTP